MANPKDEVFPTCCYSYRGDPVHGARFWLCSNSTCDDLIRRDLS